MVKAKNGLKSKSNGKSKIYLIISVVVLIGVISFLGYKYQNEIISTFGKVFNIKYKPQTQIQPAPGKSLILVCEGMLNFPDSLGKKDKADFVLNASLKLPIEGHSTELKLSNGEKASRYNGTLINGDGKYKIIFNLNDLYENQATMSLYATRAKTKNQANFLAVKGWVEDNTTLHKGSVFGILTCTNTEEAVK